MRRGFQYILSLIFIIQMYLAMLVLALAFAPYALVSRSGAFAAIHCYCRWVRFTAAVLVGLKSEIRGKVPEGEVLVCAKHQSFFDIIMIVSVLPRPRFVMKSQLRFAPIVGQYASRIGCIAVDRGKRAKAVQQMVDGVEASKSTPGQLVIYPQGTRVAPGVQKPYKIGSGILYAGLKQDCVPAATNVGVFWPRHGIYRKPGLAVVEFLTPIKSGLPTQEFMAELKDVVETASDRLMAEAGFDPADPEG